MRVSNPTERERERNLVRPQQKSIKRAPLIYLPWSPSVNRLWKSYRNNVCRSQEYKDYLLSCEASYLEQGRPKLEEHPGVELDVLMYFFPPYRRYYDVDNRIKATLDALTHLGFWTDDRIIKRISATKCSPCEKGATIVEVFYNNIPLIDPATFGLIPLKEVSSRKKSR